MANIRNLNEIILNLIDYFKLAQPNLDTKVGTVARDLFIEGPSSGLSLLYDHLALISSQQSLRQLNGSDLDNFGKNFGITRKQPTFSTGVALLTFSSLNAPIGINKGDLVYASNGFSFRVLNGLTISVESGNFYKSIASKYRNDLDFNGISDQYAVEVTVQAISSGTSGNIGKYSLIRTSIIGISNVINVNAFSGGTNQESDAFFKDRIASSLSGASIGTDLGYKNIALSTEGVSDALIIGPGDPLMLRDGTIVENDVVVSEGAGGKTDVVILGTSLQENVDSFIYRDKSNTNDATNAKNNFVLGQIVGDENKTINKKRIDNIKSGILPVQPVQELLEVSASSSGSNFVPKKIDQFGRVTGNYELVKDTGLFAGSPWGFDTFKFISNKISLFSEDRIKNQFNSKDDVTFTDVIEIPIINQNVQIINENSNILSDRSLVKLKHSPVSNVTRVFNLTTGERYVITDQNPQGTGSLNTSGVVKISGNTLPTSSDLLQVDYNWVVEYDQYSDYDGLNNTYNITSVGDSIDWGYANLIRDEKVLFVQDPSLNFYTGSITHSSENIIYANQYEENDGYVYKILSGPNVNRLAVDIKNYTQNITTVNSVKFGHNEAFKTIDLNGSFSVVNHLIGIDNYYDLTVILPTDTIVVEGDIVSVFTNETDVFNASILGTVNNKTITVPASNVDSSSTQIYLKVSYISSSNNLNNFSINSLPIARSGNSYLNSTNVYSDLIKKDSLVVQKNLSNQFYLDLGLSASSFTINKEDVLSIIRISDMKELWNSNNVGSVITDVNNNINVIFSGYNLPQIGDRVLAMYSYSTFENYQPFTFKNKIFRSRLDIAVKDFSEGKFTFKLEDFDIESGINYTIFDKTTNEVIHNGLDGYIVPNGLVAEFGSSFNFNTVNRYSDKLIRISTNTINNGIFNITQELDGYIQVSNNLNLLSPTEISITRILDGKEVWVDGEIDLANNRLLISDTANINNGDTVMITMFHKQNLKNSSTKLSLNLSDQTINPGSLTIFGTTLLKAKDIIFTATTNGLQQQTNEIVKKITLDNNISSNIKLIKICKLEKVSTVSANSEEVLSIYNNFDVFNCKIKNNQYFSYEMIENYLLGDLVFQLPSTLGNLAAAPKIGDKLRATVFYAIENDNESLAYTTNGSLYTNKKFIQINNIKISSGFKGSTSSNFTMSGMMQPILGSRYQAFYDYVAPKQNERIIIKYNYNKIISDTTFNIEKGRPINGDVLVKAAKSVPIDITMNVVISDTFKNSYKIVLQNLKDALINAININKLNTTLDSSDLINTAYSIQGIDRVRVIYFNRNGNNGQVLSITAKKDEYFVANNVITARESR